MSYSRVRTKGAIVPTALTYRKIHGDCATTAWWTAAAVNIGVGDFSTMTDLVVPGFRRRQQIGETFFNPMSSSRVRYYGDGNGPASQTVNVQCAATGSKELTEYNGNWFARNLPGAVSADGIYRISLNPLIPGDDVEDYVREISTEAQNQRGRADANLFETLAEFNSTLAMLGPLIGRLNDRVLKLESDLRRYHGSAVAVQEIAGAWLTGRYGVKPLVKDIFHVLENLAAANVHKRITSRAKGEISSTSLETISATLNYCQYTYSRKTTETYTVRAMCLDDVYLTAVNQLGFTFKGLVTLPWELLTLSFVADWIANLGSFIGSLVPSPGWNALGSCVTVRRVLTQEYAANGDSVCIFPSSMILTRPMSGSYFAEWEDKYRSGLPSPALVIRNSFKFENPVRFADALALAAGRLMFISKKAKIPPREIRRKTGRTLPDHLWSHQ